MKNHHASSLFVQRSHFDGFFEGHTALIRILSVENLEENVEVRVASYNVLAQRRLFNKHCAFSRRLVSTITAGFVPIAFLNLH